MVVASSWSRLQRQGQARGCRGIRIDRNPLRRPTNNTAAGGTVLAARYLARNAAGYLAANVEGVPLPGRTLRSYVSRRLTSRTGVTIRNLRRAPVPVRAYSRGTTAAGLAGRRARARLAAARPRHRNTWAIAPDARRCPSPRTCRQPALARARTAAQAAARPCRTDCAQSTETASTRRPSAAPSQCPGTCVARPCPGAAIDRAPATATATTRRA
jgi:hypothetical protein